ncbi:MAG: amino acid permease [Candidatus Marsarchaeota archaeon]|nr:amino acid permease [Candidatus Marsarchaeota archaeon]MCL5111808.1 amino acid permease [Candidatus Marsarchaeota archaeon]
MQKISTITATAVGLGAIIGAGIFVLSGTAIAQAGADALLAFILVGAVALIIALELGELSTLFPRLTGASYSYVYEAFGSELGFIIGIMLYFSFATAISVVALGFGSYLTSLIGAQLGSSSIQLFAISLIIALSALTVTGMRKAARADLGLVLIKITALLVFIGFALIYAFHASGFSLHNFSVSASQGTASAFFAASIVIFFAYTGFQAIVTLTPRIKGGGRSAAKATILSVAISMVLYISIVAVLMLLMPASQYTVSGDPLASALNHANAPLWISIVVGIGALVATASATLAMMMAASNQLHQVGRDRLLPKILRGYNAKRGVSTKGVVITAVIAMVMLFSGNIFVMAAISNFGLLTAFLMTGFALMHFRRRGSTPEFKMPLYPYLPVAGIVAILLFMIGMPKTALVIGTIMVLSLIAIYYTLRELAGRRVVKVKLFR